MDYNTSATDYNTSATDYDNGAHHHQNDTYSACQSLGDINYDYDYVAKLWDVNDGLWLFFAPLLIFPGTIGNIVSIITLQSPDFRETSISFTVSALAAADICVLNTGCLFDWMTVLTKSKMKLSTLSSAGCKVYSIAVYFSIHLSAWSLALVTIERFISVTRPLKSFIMCSKRRMIIAWIIILLCLLGADMFLFVLSDKYEEEVYEPCGNHTRVEQWCSFHPDEELRLKRHLERLDLLLSCLGPSAIIFTANTIIIVKLVQGHRRRQQTLNTGERLTDRTRSVSIMLFSVSIAFLLLTLPINILLLGDEYFFPNVDTDPVEEAWHELTFTITSLLNYVNSTINVLLYLVTGTKFRRAFLRVFCPSCKKKDVNKQSITSASVNTSVCSRMWIYVFMDLLRLKQSKFVCMGHIF